jgi:hypothetical protein
MFIKTAVATAIVIFAASGAVAAKNQKVQGAYESVVSRNAEAYSTGYYYQGTPMDKLPIWRRGSYLGNDPDSRIRFNLMRDGRGHAY